jgi:hypothetical protein
MSVEIKKIDDELSCYTFICNDTGKRMLNVWSRSIGGKTPVQTVEAKWFSSGYAGSGPFEIEGVLSCTPIDDSRFNTEIVDFMTDEISGDVKLTAFVKQK